MFDGDTLYDHIGFVIRTSKVEINKINFATKLIFLLIH